MSTNGPNSQESVGENASIAHTVCHDCPHEQLHSAKRPADAKELAVDDAIEHGRASGHTVDEDLVQTPPTTITAGPEIEDTKVVQR